MAVCVDEGFQVDELGRLSHKLCGDPADTVWPYTCSSATGNPIRLDPDCGLWVPPSAKASTTFADGQTSTTLHTVPVADVEVETADIVVQNPSPCLRAFVIRWVNVDVTWRLPPGTDSRAAASIDGNSFQLVENPAPPGAENGTEMTDVHWEYTQTLIGGGTIPPGGSLLYSTPIAVGNGQGGAQYGQVRWAVRALALAMP